MATLAVRNGTVATAQGLRPVDVVVEGERIAALRPAGAARAARTLDASGCLVLPGAVDAHVHVGIHYVRLDGLTVRSADRFADASRAAAHGGTTTIVDFAMQDVGQDLLGPLEQRLAAVRASAVDVALHCWVMDPSDEALAQVPELVARGVPSFKAFMAYSQLGQPMSDGELFDLMAAVGDAGGLLALHAENAGLNARRSEQARRSGRTGFDRFAASRPAVGEEEAVARALVLARAAGVAVYFVHLSTAAAARRLATARAEGQAAHGETCPHFLHFDESRYDQPRAADFAMGPPLRTPADRDALWRALVDGVIEVVATDHTAWPRAVKAYGRGFLETIQGVAGLGLLLPLLAAAAAEGRGGFGWEALARVTAEAPARIFGLRPRKGVLEPGADADLVVLDPAAVRPVPDTPPGWVVDNGIYRGLPAIYPREVLRRGQPLVEAGRYVGPDSGGGAFVAGRLAAR